MSTYDRIKALSSADRETILADVTNFSDREMEERYKEALNEQGPVSICGFEYEPATALQAVDPTAYRCGFADYCGTDDSLVEIDGTYYVEYDLEKALDAFDEAQEPAREILLDEARGVYIPQAFATQLDMEAWHVKPEQVETLSEGPDGEWYWETWDDVLRDAYYDAPESKDKSIKSGRWTLEQDGSLFAVLYK